MTFKVTCGVYTHTFIAVGTELLKLILSRDVLLLFLTNMKLLSQVFDDLEFFAHFDFLLFSLVEIVLLMYTLIFFRYSFTYLVEISSSWNFPARASPSYEGSEPSQAGAH